MISVIIPVYNISSILKLFSGMLYSVVQQTYWNLEIILVANVKKKVGQCLKKTRPPALEKNQATWPKNA